MSRISNFLLWLFGKNWDKDLKYQNQKKKILPFIKLKPDPKALD